MKKITSLALLLLLETFAFAQQDNRLVISGNVYDAVTREVLPYANISFDNGRFGVVANGSGQFKVLVPQRFMQQNLTVSFLGYENKKIIISSDSQSLKVYLKPQSLALKEAVVEGYTGKFLYGKAIAQMPVNYLGPPHISKGFYRVTTQSNGDYIHLSEAVFEIYKDGSASAKKPFKLLKMRATKDEAAAHGISIGHSPRSIISNDIATLDDSGLTSKSMLKTHDFELTGSKTYDGARAYEVTFRQKDDIKKQGFIGTVLIDQQTFAFLRFEYRSNPATVQYVKVGGTAMRALMKLLGIKAAYLGGKSIIHYKKIGDYYFLSDVRDDSELSFASDRENYQFVTQLRSDYVVTEVQQENVVAPTKEELLNNRKMIENLDVPYDQQFWDNFNIILPDQDFGEIARSIEMRNQQHNYKKQLEDVIFKYPKEKDARIDSILSFYNRKDLFNGNALVALGDEVIFQKSYNNDKTNNQEGASYRIGSTSKTFTSMLILLLAEKGLVNFDDRAGKYLPDFVHGDVTIAQLLSHQSGIPNYLSDEAYMAQIYEKAYPTAELVRKFCSDSLDFAPGSKFDYSNSGYLVLAAIIEQVTQMSMAEALRTYIFQPLEMKDTYFGEQADDQKVVGYLFGQPEPPYPIQNVVGAGGISSTTEDLLKWSLALGKGTLISTEKFETLIKPRAAYLDWDAQYGYGWLIDLYQFSNSRKHRIIYHPGTDNGFYSMFVKQPDEGITIILLNSSGDFPRFEITDLILDELDR